MTARLVILISGNGSNLQAVMDAIRLRVLPAQIVAVISNRKAALGLERAAKENIPTRYHPLKPYREANRSRRDYDADLAARLLAYDLDLVVMAGLLHIFSAEFLRHFPYRVVNLHPALPGCFPGPHAIAEALAAWQAGKIKHTGCMVHLVPDDAVDSGPIIGTAEVPTYPSDSLETLAARMHAAEHPMLIQSLLRLVEGDEEIDESDELDDGDEKDSDDWDDAP